jgi:hypothetical protein
MADEEDTSGESFMQKHMREASFDERYPRAVWGGGKGPSIDAAFSGKDPSKTEFPLGRALREKAKKMKSD